MNLVVRYEGAEYEVAVDTDGRGGTVADLIAPWCRRRDVATEVDGRAVVTTLPIAELGIADGSVLDVSGEQFELRSARDELPRGRGVFNRPPRAITPSLSTTLELPPPPPQAVKAMRFGWGALVVPIALGLAMAVLVHPRMAMFAIFSPAMLLANWFEDRRTARKERKENGEAFRSALDRFEAEVAAAYRHEVEEQWRMAPLPGVIAARAMGADSRLWERRPQDDDFMRIPIGSGCINWKPELRGDASAEVNHVLDRFAELHEVPVMVDLTAGNVVGVAGSRSSRVALARQLVLQAAVAHGPADLAVSVFTENIPDWDWAKWLPHVNVDDSGRRRLAGNPAEAGELVGLLPLQPGERGGASLHLLVVDLPDLLAGARGEIRDALRAGASRGIAGLTLAPRPVDLPSVSKTIVAVGESAARVRHSDGVLVDLEPWSVAAATARATARALARIEDPEESGTGCGLPHAIQLVSLLDHPEGLEAAMRGRWRSPERMYGAPIGMAEDGVLSIDLVADGPHALLGGTTGAGKSELLRSLVAALATTTSPAALNFVLVDYKGGSAFDACADLPHTVGLVTDLDDHLALRALTCLEAELRYRERVLRKLGVSDISAVVQDGTRPLPRLLVVVDEFAALAKEMPDFMESLVDVAQRGRSLGVHLILATQRPNGVISDSIKANTNLRIALRVQDTADSIDVVGCGDAATIGRNQPGRGLVRLGPDDVAPFQTALVTGCSQIGSRAVRVQPFIFAHEQPPWRVEADSGTPGPTDLERIVTAAVRVAEEMGIPPGRLPWPLPLPSTLLREDIPETRSISNGTVYALADEPRQQRQVATSWSPASGNLLMYGLPGSGTTTALAAIVTGLAGSCDPNELHMYGIDFDDQALLPLQTLPHVGAVVGAGQRERQLRLLRHLSRELNDRRSAVGADPESLSDYQTIVTFLDNYAGFTHAFDEPGEMSIRNLFLRLAADGPGVGMLTIATAKQPGDIPNRLASLVGSKLAFRLADRYDYSAVGVPPVDPPTGPGRAFESGSGRELQIVLPHRDGLNGAINGNRWGRPEVAPAPIEILPRDVSVADVIAAGQVSDQEWFLPIGIGNSGLSPAGLVLREGDHALITGPARSGKSTALATLATVAKAAFPDLTVLAVVPRRSPLSDCVAVDLVVGEDLVADLAGRDGAQLLLVDDAELITESPSLADLVRMRRPGLHVVAAGSADAIRSMYGHWTHDVRRSRIGCALRPNVATDGDLWQTTLPRRGPERFPTGRGYLLADGEAELVQLGRK